MTIAVSTLGRNKGTFGVAATSVGYAATLTGGAALRVLLATDSGISPSSVTDGTNTYVNKGSLNHTFYGVKLTQYIAENIAGGSLTVTGNFSSSNMQWIMVQQITGQAATCYDGQAMAYQPNPSSTSTDGITTGNITPANQPNLFAGFIVGAGGSSPGTGFNFDTFGGDFPIAGVGYSGNWATEYLRTTSTSAKACTWTNGNSGDYILTAAMVFDELVAGANLGAALHHHLQNMGAR